MAATPWGDGRPPPRASPAYGISEQSFRNFADPDLRTLGLRLARIVVSYDVVERAELGFFDERSGRYSARGDRSRPGELENLDRWMRAARAGGYEPLVSFQFSRGRPERLPSLPEYRAGVRAFLDRYAGGRDAAGAGPDGGSAARPTDVRFTAWNEPNFRAQPTFGRPRQAARYYLALRELCRGRCTVAAGDLLQAPAYEAGALGTCGEPPGSRACDGGRFPEDGRRMSQRAFIRRYARELRGARPGIWAYHPYGDANLAAHGRRGTAGVDALAREAIDASPIRYRQPEAVRIWLTEAGGILENSPGSKLETRDEGERDSPRGPAPATPEELEQVEEVRHLVGAVARADPRIERLYYYSFRVAGFPSSAGCRNFSGFDSGLVRECALAGQDGIGGRPAQATVRRPAYSVFAEAVARSRGGPAPR